MLTFPLLGLARWLSAPGPKVLAFPVVVQVAQVLKRTCQLAGHASRWGVQRREAGRSPPLVESVVAVPGGLPVVALAVGRRLAAAVRVRAGAGAGDRAGARLVDRERVPRLRV